jgi:hypothetical protein
VTNAAELLRLARAAVGGELLSAERTAEMLTVVDANYTLGWSRTNTRRNTTRISHGGDVRGFHTQLALFPDENAAIVLLSNVDEAPMYQLAGNVEALLLGGEVPYPSPPKLVEVQEKALKRLEGRYVPDDGGAGVTVTVAEGVLLVESGDDTTSALLNGRTSTPPGPGAPAPDRTQRFVASPDDDRAREPSVFVSYVWHFPSAESPKAPVPATLRFEPNKGTPKSLKVLRGEEVIAEWTRTKENRPGSRGR